jgi:hypothetical protein
MEMELRMREVVASGDRRARDRFVDRSRILKSRATSPAFAMPMNFRGDDPEWAGTTRIARENAIKIGGMRKYFQRSILIRDIEKSIDTFHYDGC